MDDTGTGETDVAHRMTIKQGLVTPFVFAVVCCFYVYLTWHNEFVDLLSDSAVYLLMASFMDAGQQVPETVRHVALSDYHFPPLYPFVLWVFGGGSAHPFASHVINSVLVIMSLACFLLWIRLQGEEWMMALVLVVVVAVLPVTTYFSNFIVSEYLFMSLAFLALAALDRSVSKQRNLYWAALLIGFAVLTRFMGVALLPVLACVAFRARRGHLIPVLAAAVCLPLLWSLYKATFGSSNYVNSFFLSHKGDFVTSILTYAWVNLQVLGLSWVKSFDHYISGYSTLPSIALGLVVFAGWIHRIVQGKADAIYILVYFLILLPWPHPDHIHRFLLPVLPILLFYATVGAKLAAERLGLPSRRALIIYGPLAIAVAMTLPTNVTLVQRLVTPLPAHLSDFGRSQYWLFTRDPDGALQSMEFLHTLLRSLAAANAIPRNECVWSIEPERQMLMSLRAAYTTPRPGMDDASFERAAKKCRYFFVINAVPNPNHSKITAFYPAERIGSTAEVVEQFEHEKFGVVSALMKRKAD